MALRLRQGTGRIRLADVARRVGVSAVTVSRVLREPRKVAEPTRSRVLAAVAELGYVPNLVARSLALTRSGIIAAIFPTLDNSLHAEVAQGMAEVLREAGLHLLLGSTGFSVRDEEALVAAFLARQPDGLFLNGISHTEGTRRLLAGAGVPVVEGANLTDAPIDLVVGYSSFAAGHAITELLIARGYRTIGYVGSEPGDNDRVRDRREGHRAALVAAGRGVDPELTVEVPEISFEAGAAGLATLLGRRPDVAAVFCSSDVIAVGALFECRRRGWRVPGRVAIAGFDDLPIASQIVPALTTVRIPRREMGRRAALMLLRRLAGERIEVPVVDLGFEIVRRESA